MTMTARGDSAVDAQSGRQSACDSLLTLPRLLSTSAGRMRGRRVFVLLLAAIMAVLCAATLGETIGGVTDEGQAYLEVCGGVPRGRAWL